MVTLIFGQVWMRHAKLAEGIEMHDPMMQRARRLGRPMTAMCDMIFFAAERLLEIEVRSLAAVGYGEKSPNWLFRRKGTANAIGTRGPDG